MKKYTLFIAVFFSLCLGLFAQSTQKVSVFPVKNETKLPYIDALSGAVIDNIIFMMSQMEDYSAADDRDVTIPSFTAKDFKKASKGKRAHYIIYGSISGSSPLTLSLSVFDLKKKEVISTHKGSIHRMTEVFSISDSLSLKLLEDITGEVITRGVLRFVNTGDAGLFEASVNGKKIDAGVGTLPIMKGSYAVKVVAFNGVEKVEVFSETVEVTEGEDSLIEFVIPQVEIAEENREEGEESVKDRMQVGELELINTGAFDLYKVFLNDVRMGSSLTQTYLEEGEYSIKIETSQEYNEKKNAEAKIDNDHQTKKDTTDNNEKKNESTIIYSGTIKIEDGKKTVVKFAVPGKKDKRNKRKGSGVVRFVNQWNETYIPVVDGIDLPAGTQSYTLRSGIHKIEVYSRGAGGKREFLYSKQVIVVNGQEKDIEFTMNPLELAKKAISEQDTGLLIFKNKGTGPNWWVEIDGETMDRSWTLPTKKRTESYRVSPGVHKVKVFEPVAGIGSLRRLYKTIEVISGEEYVIEFLSMQKFSNQY